MSNVDLARGSYDAFRRGDADAYVDCFSEDTEWYVSAMLTGKVRYSGHAGIREFLRDVERLGEEHGESFRADLDEFTEIDESRVLGLGMSHIEREENPLDFESGLIYTFADEKIARLDVFTSHQQAREAAGLA
jgi:ketosteroid isomerase-like protein